MRKGTATIATVKSMPTIRQHTSVAPRLLSAFNSRVTWLYAVDDLVLSLGAKDVIGIGLRPLHREY